MLTVASIATVVGYWLVGAVLYRAMVLRLCRLDDEAAGLPMPSDRDLLLRSVLPALGIVGTIGTYLALFRVFRADVTLAASAALLLWRRRDALLMLKAIQGMIAEAWSGFRGGDLLPLAAAGVLCTLGYFLVILAHIPTQNVDAWVFQLPLAQSMVEHHGFVHPQINHLFYSNNPLFFNLLFAQAFLFAEHFVAAGIVNIFIYLGFLVCVASFAPRIRSLALLLVLYFIASSRFFSPGAAEPLTDIPRTCYSVLALLFAHRYLLQSRVYELATAGLLAGAAVAGKYTELITVVLIGSALLPRLLTDKRVWRDAAIFAAIFFVVAGYWYLKNLMLFGNPIYPFVFGHPGLSNEWMAEYMRDLGQAFDPADRIYVTNLLTLRGWHDFGFILKSWFLDKSSAQFAAIVIVAGLVVRGVKIVVPVVWTATLFVIWYVLMFNHIRWAMPADLSFLSTACLAVFLLFDICAAKLPALAVGFPVPQWMKLRLQTAARHRISLQLALAALVIGLGAWAIVADKVSNDLVGIALGRSSIEKYLSTHRQGYALYRYVATHDLRMVFQPFDNGAIDFARYYNGGRDGNWILPYRTLPADGEAIGKFVVRHDIRYFIYRKSLTAVEIDRFGQFHVDRANRVFAALLPMSHLLLTDLYGWSLYEIDRAAIKRDEPPSL